jgi:hypothetical protein
MISAASSLLHWRLPCCKGRKTIFTRKFKNLNRPMGQEIFKTMKPYNTLHFLTLPYITLHAPTLPYNIFITLHYPILSRAYIWCWPEVL